ncbi:MAG: transglutaminase domain-containing protein [Candidatus Sumerlaeia bacterium]|nr:transglutaminase domain-containing protein [Candidatus Sumerlaeia bacterium]
MTARLPAMVIVMVMMNAFIFGWQLPNDIQAAIDGGRFAEARVALEQAAAREGLADDERHALLYEVERLDRIRAEHTLGDDELFRDLAAEIPDLTPADIDAWYAAGLLEGRVIEGERRFFKRAIRNLFRLSPEVRARRSTPDAPAPTGDREISIEERMAGYLEMRRAAESSLVAPTRFRIRYTLTVKPDVVPAGEEVRCWLVFPRQTPTQSSVRLLSSNPAEAVVAPNETMQRTVFLRRPAVAGEPTLFEVDYEFATFARVEIVDPAAIVPHDPDARVVREFTAERPPHLAFTPELRALAREIVGDETNPYLKARRIFEWIDGNIRYTSALEYGTIPNLSGWCAAHRRGDCGIQALLFIVLCRIEGVPAKWQSGWSLLPGRVNMHDWAEFHVEPYGWLPADPSRGLRPSDDPAVRWFNFGNMDPYRLVSNDDYGTELVPPKQHFRSEPVDFQRGEVEWNGGNLYFDAWTYRMQATEIE